MGVNKVLYGNRTLIDISDSTVTPETLGSGIVAYNAMGEKIVGVGNIRTLPSDHVPLNYIQSNGTQCIDTLYNFKSNNVKIEIEFEYTGSNGGSSIMGCQDTTITNASGVIVYGSNPNVYNGASYGVNIGWRTSLNTVYKMIIELNEGSIIGTLNGNVYTGSYKGAINTTETFTLFGCHIDNKYKEFASMRLWLCKMYDDNILVRDYIPFNAAGEYGLFDKVNYQFYGNAGTGSFTGA